jgi:hypothetical protein
MVMGSSGVLPIPIALKRYFRRHEGEVIARAADTDAVPRTQPVVHVGGSSRPAGSLSTAIR